MKDILTQEEMEKRLAEIEARPPEELTPEEKLQLARAEAMDDGTTVTLEEYKKSLEQRKIISITLRPKIVFPRKRTVRGAKRRVEVKKTRGKEVEHSR